MRKAQSMELIAPSKRFNKGKSTTPLDMETLNDLRRKKLCFYCKGPYDRDQDFPIRPKGKANRVM